MNDCAHPAPPNSVVTIFVNGLGQTTPALTTGALATAPALTLTPSVTVLSPAIATLNAVTKTLPGALDGVSQVQFQVPAFPASLSNAYAVTPSLLGVTLRERLALIWVE